MSFNDCPCRRQQDLRCVGQIIFRYTNYVHISVFALTFVYTLVGGDPNVYFFLNFIT